MTEEKNKRLPDFWSTRKRGLCDKQVYPEEPKEFEMAEDIVTTTMEFAIDFADSTNLQNVKSLVEHENGLKLLDIDLKKQQVIIETKLPSGTVHKILEQSGNTVVFRGHGYSQGTGHIGAAVTHIMGDKVNGVVRFVQASEDCCVIDGTIEGLPQGKHGLHIHELGDLSNGCKNTGNHFNPGGTRHGNRTDKERHVGDLGNIISDNEQRSIFRFQDDRVKVWDVIGRSMVVDSEEDTFQANDNCSTGIACGIIARSAGLFENVKRVCQCSGKTLWEERQDVKQSVASQL